MRGHRELSGTTTGGKVGCLVGVIVGIHVAGVLMFFAFYGHCGPDDLCRQGQFLRFLVVLAITLTVAVPIGLATRSFVNRRFPGEAE